MALIQRVQDILLKPKDTWPAIAQETASVGSIYNGYLIYLAAIPAIATFIGLSLVGVGGFGFGMRIPIVTGLVNMVVGYVLSLPWSGLNPESNAQIMARTAPRLVDLAAALATGLAGAFAGEIRSHAAGGWWRAVHRAGTQ